MNTVKSPALNAVRVGQFLIQDAGFSKNHILLLTDEKATTNNILYAMELLGKAVRPDDLVVIYFCTHGTGSPTDPRIPNVITTHDIDFKQNIGIPMKIYGDIVKKLVPSNRVVTILDVCFSGNVRDLDPGAQERFNEELQGCGQIVVASSKNPLAFWKPS